MSSVSGLSSNLLYSQLSSSSAQSRFQQIKQGFQQLGQDLQSGNLTQAQSDFAALQQYLPSSQTGSSSQTGQTGTLSNNPLGQAVSQLASDLQSGNLSAAQSDFATVQQDAQQAGAQHGGFHHHSHGTALLDNTQSSTEQTSLSTLFAQLGQAIQSGNLSTAQTTYSSLQQELQAFGIDSSSTSLTGSTPDSTTTNSLLNITI